MGVVPSGGQDVDKWTHAAGVTVVNVDGLWAGDSDESPPWHRVHSCPHIENCAPPARPQGDTPLTEATEGYPQFPQDL